MEGHCHQASSKKNRGERIKRIAKRLSSPNEMAIQNKPAIIYQNYKSGVYLLPRASASGELVTGSKRNIQAEPFTSFKSF